MDRELKFRAWCKETKKMYLPGDTYIDQDSWLTDSLTAVNYTLNGKHSPLEWMQYTGLKDKNGAEIYEGDIVSIEHPCWSAMCRTDFFDGAFYFVELDNPVQNAQIRADQFLKEKWKIKVISNVYKSPELSNKHVNS